MSNSFFPVGRDEKKQKNIFADKSLLGIVKVAVLAQTQEYIVCVLHKNGNRSALCEH